MNRDEAIKKIISAVYSQEIYEKVASEQPQNTVSEEDRKLIEKLTSASSMLKFASAKIASMEEENNQLKGRISDLESTISTIERHDEAEKLAGVMLAKGMIKKSEVDSQIDKIMAFDKTGFEVFKDAIENVSTEKTAGVSEGASSLAFMYGDSLDEAQTDANKTMAEAINAQFGRK